jgi:D-glycero-D-manno-heptose 1,7-bisphosphate phosphatase
MRIAQITDLHLRHHLPGVTQNKRRIRHMAELFPRALDTIAQQQVDLVAVTGDLVDVPDWLMHPLGGFEYDDAAIWRDAALKDYQLVRDALDASGLRYMVLPGNHDDESLMWQVFDAEANAIDVAGHRVIRFCDREWEYHMPRRFTPQRERWEAALEQTDGPPQIHLQHYLVTPWRNAGWPHTYEEGDEIARRTNAAGHVRLSLSGHDHTGTGLIRFTNTTFAACPAFTVSPFTWRVYDVDESVTMTQHALGHDTLERQRVVFLDRDGVINDLASYRHGPEQMRLIPGAGDAIRKLREAGFAVVVITGQTAIGMGYVPAGVVVAVNDKMYRLLAECGAAIDGLYFLHSAGSHSVLPQLADNSMTKADLMRQAVSELNLDITGAFMVGDRIADIDAGREVDGVTPILVRTGRGAKVEPQLNDDTLVVDDLTAVAHHMLGSV